MSAASKLGLANPRFKERVLKSGSADYQEYLALQKDAVPRWHKFFDEHGEPDYILPAFGQNCTMVWAGEGISAAPTLVGTISSDIGVPAEIRTHEAQVNATNQHRLSQSRREMEDAVRKNAIDSYYSTRTANSGHTVVRFKIERMEYVDATKRGVSTIVVDGGDYSIARIWTRSYIEALAKDKNVALRTGQDSEEGVFFLKDETIADGLYSVTFETL